MTELVARHRGLVALAARETHRVLKLWTQTILAPVISSLLFIVVFGLSLGGRIREIDGVPYDQFIVPGLIAMAMAQAAYSNNASSTFQARFDRYIHDVLASPMRGWEINLGLSLGGAVRSLAIGLALGVVAVPITGIPVREPLALALAVLALLLAFCALGVVVGIYAESFDHHMAVNNVAILPLAFLGGVFYSVELLPSPWEEISHLNPVFYLVQAVRFGFLGTADVPYALAIGVTLGCGVVFVVWSAWLFRTGKRLKP